MKVPRILLVLIGFVFGLLLVLIYQQFRVKPGPAYVDGFQRLRINEEVFKQRANAIVVAAGSVAPAVVSITVVSTRVVATSPFFSPFSEQYFQDFFRDFFPERYYRQQVRSLGTGMIISADGYVLTNEHVVVNAEEIMISLADGRQFRGTVIAADPTNDLALLKVDGNGLPYIRLGNSDDLMIGEWVIALGNPFGFLLEDISPTVTVGVISATHRSIKSTDGSRLYKNMIQTDAAINPGNSGGPLVNITGEVIGINTFIFTSGGGSEGIGFARPVNIARKFIKETQNHGKVRVPWIGLWLQNLTPAMADSMRLKPLGILVTGLDENSPAQRAGIKNRDQIIGLNGSSIRKVNDWDRFVADVFVDDTLVLDLMRGDDTLCISMVVQEYKGSPPTTKFGIHVENIDSNLARKYNIGYREGVIVVRIDPGSIGDRVGIRIGDVVLKIGDRRIRNRSDFQEALKTARQVDIIIDRGGLILQSYFSF